MAIIRWKPYQELDNLRKEVDRRFDNYMRNQSEESESLSSCCYPLVDIKETKDDYYIYAEIPGIAKEDVKITIQNDTLVIKGEKKEEKEEEDHNYHRIERQYGSFQRSFQLPSQVQGDKVKASYKDGILMIVLPKKEEVKPKEISISVS